MPCFKVIEMKDTYKENISYINFKSFEYASNDCSKFHRKSGFCGKNKS